MSYDIHLDVYDGPMEMLLDLIRKNKIDIYDIPIGFLADEFVREMEEREISLDLVSDFLVMAASLLEIKSRMLLPKKEEEEEEDPRKELVQRILEYRKFREAAFSLKKLEEWEAGSFYRKQEEFLSPDDVSLLEEGNPEDLTRVLSKLLARAKPVENEFFHKLRPEFFPVSKTIDTIRTNLVTKDSMTFTSLLSEFPTKEEVISYFLACLELTKFHEIRIRILEDDLRIERRDHE